MKKDKVHFFKKLALKCKKEKILKIDILFTIFVFLLFLIILFLSPLSGDDWGNFVGSNGNLISSIKIAISGYKTFEGRFFSRIFINFLVSYKEFWNILNSLIISLIYFFVLRITKHKDKFITPIALLLAILLVDEEAFRQAYVWLAGNITYLFPSFLVFLILYINRFENLKHRKITYVVLPIITIISSMFVETVSVGIIIGYLVYLIYYYIKYKKVDICYLISFLCSILGLCLMVFAPGTMNRLGDYQEFKNLSLLGKIGYNLPNFIKFTFINNSFLILLLVIFILVFGKKYIKNKIVFGIVSLYSTIIPLLTALVYYLKTLKINISPLQFLLNSNSTFIMIFWLIFSFLLIYLFVKYMKEYKNIQALYLVLIGILANCSMFISPIWGGRTALLTTLCLSFAMIIILCNHKLVLENNKVLQIGGFIALALFTLFLLVGYSTIYVDNLKREEIIRNDLKDNRDSVRILVLSDRFLWNPNPWSVDGWLYKTIKKYYKIAPSKDLELIFKRDL